MHGRLGILGAALVAGAVLLAGCSDPDQDGDDSRPAEVPVEFRAVITSSHLEGGCQDDAAACEAWEGFECPGEPQQLSGDRVLACGTGDDADQGYLLAAASFVGGIADAEPANHQGAAQWEVEVELDNDATRSFAALTADLVPNSAQIAIVLDEEVLAAPAVQTEITDGVFRLAGDYTEEEAEALADRLEP